MSDTAVLPRAQNNTHTGAGRNDQYIDALASAVGPDTVRRALSFGCSEGFECLSLRRAFPGAQIFGCDVNESVLSVARSVCGAQAEVFLSESAALSRHGPFDLITAFNVLCRYPSTKDMTNIAGAFPFALFEELLSVIDRAVAPGGVLMLYNAQYFLQDTALGARYTPIPTTDTPDVGFIHRHSPEGQRLTHVTYRFEDGSELGQEEGIARIKGVLADTGVNLILARRAWCILSPLDPQEPRDFSAIAFRKTSDVQGWSHAGGSASPKRARQ